MGPGEVLVTRQRGESYLNQSKVGCRRGVAPDVSKSMVPDPFTWEDGSVSFGADVKEGIGTVEYQVTGLPHIPDFQIK